MSLKQQLHDDLTAALKAREPVRVATLRMALTAVTNEEVAGSAARELTDEQVVTVLVRESRRRREAAEAYAAAGRPELAEREEAELEVLAGYLPAPLTDAELGRLVDEAVAETGATEPRQLGQVMKVLTPRVAGRAEGAQVAAEVRRRLGG